MTGRSGRRCLISSSNFQSVHAGHVDIRQDRDECGVNFLRKPIQCLRTRGGEVHHIGSLSGLMAKSLAEKLGDIGFVVYDQDAHTHDAASVDITR